MNLWRQLRWRIVAANMVVVIVGVVLVLVMSHLITQYVTPAEVQERLTQLAAARSPEAAAAAQNELLAVFRQSILTAVSVAAGGAVIAGILSSLLLSRQILRPLRQLAHSSQRIAHGHYAERLTVPPSDELALVAINFNQMAEALEQVEQQRITLIGDISHELRTPLTGLKGYLEGLMDGVFPSDEETFAHMYQEVRRLGRLVDDLQALSQVEAGQILLHPQTFDLLPLIERVVAQIQPQAEAQSLTITLDALPPPILVLADPDRTAQVLLNLLSNAIRYTPDGGRITVRASRRQPHAQIAVADTGMGIPAAALPYLFERFYRVDPSRDRRSGGSGIGLTIARHLVWGMGGDLTAASPGPDQGSLFTFTLLLAPKAGE